MTVQTFKLCLFVSVLLFVFHNPGFAAPYVPVPESNDVVVCELPSSELHRKIRSLKTSLQREGTNLNVHLDLLRAFLNLNRRA